MAGAIYLIPSTLGASGGAETLAPATVSVLRRLSHFVVETPKQARAFLKLAGVALADRTLHLDVLNEHTVEGDLPRLLEPALAGADLGLLSDAGCPAVADPGARLVRLAHAHGVRVVPLVGPSAILLALMASGLNGQRFAFHGYLPIEAGARSRALRGLEADAQRLDQTQIAIEAPYRNTQLLRAIVATCANESVLCIATDVSLSTESIRTQTIKQWRRELPRIDRRPTVFLLGTAS